MFGPNITSPKEKQCVVADWEPSGAQRADDRGDDRQNDRCDQAGPNQLVETGPLARQLRHGADRSGEQSSRTAQRMQ